MNNRYAGWISKMIAAGAYLARRAGRREVALVDSGAMERLKQFAIIVAVLTVGVVLVGLFHAFQLLISNPIALVGSVVLGVGMVWIFLRVALVPERRHTGWVRGITGPNARWLFVLLLLVWGGGMAFLAMLNLGPQEAGAPALVGLFVGIFLFMGFIWSVIGE
jgi:hypothetical protein